MKTESFEDFLKDIHAEDYYGTDDGKPEAFEKWCGGLDVQELIDYADLYGIKMHALGVQKILEEQNQAMKRSVENAK